MRPTGEVEVYLYSFFNLGARCGWVVSVTPRPHFTPAKDPVSIVQEAGWAPGPVWTGAENLASTGIRSPDRPASSQSLHRRSKPKHTPLCTGLKLQIEFLSSDCKASLSTRHQKCYQRKTVLIAVTIIFSIHVIERIKLLNGEFNFKKSTWCVYV